MCSLIHPSIVRCKKGDADIESNASVLKEAKQKFGKLLVSRLMTRLTSDETAFVERAPCLTHKLSGTDTGTGTDADGSGRGATHGVRLPKRNKKRQDRVFVGLSRLV